MPTTDLEENKIKQTQPKEGNDTAQNEREIRKNIFKNERVNFILGVILVIFSLYLTISFISFFFTGSIDQSKVENLSVGELSSIGNEIQNWTGAFGAYLSNLMINRWMGISAFIVSLWLYVVGRRFMKVAHTRMIRFTISCALSIIVLSLFFGFIFMHSYNNTFLYLGGYHGYYATLRLNAWIGPWGTALFIIALVIILLVHLSYKTIEYIRRVSSVNLTGKAIQAIKNKTDNPETDNENDNRGTESNEIQNTENIPSSENDIVNTLPEYPDDPTEEIPTLEDIQENILPVEEETKRVTIETGDPDFVIETAETEVLATQAPMEDYDPTKDLSHYKRPTFALLDKRENSEAEINMEEQSANKKLITETLKNYNIEISSITATVGPTVTLYEIKPAPGVRIARIKSLENDIALSLSALGIRIIAPIPGKGTVGIEVPNKENVTVAFRELIESEEFKKHPSDIAFAAGKDIAGKVIVADIAKMPHLLIAGATGSGKSVCINTIIMSILYKADPEDVKLIMIDPKVVELSVYNGIPHLFIPVVTDPKKASGALHWAVSEMTDRYQKFAEYGVRDLKGYNKKVEGIKDIEDENKPKKMPQIVIIVDELADLMMVAPGEVEDAICRLAQLARAAGIHLIIATQRPSVNVITGLIKANMPSRVAFAVTSGVDSRTILDMNGAEKLLGKGDMLFYPQGYSKPLRVQGAFVSDKEVQSVVDFLTEKNGNASYDPGIEDQIHAAAASTGAAAGMSDANEKDAYFADAARLLTVSYTHLTLPTIA